MQNEAESLLNAIEVNEKERQEIYRLYNLLKEWQKLMMQSNYDQLSSPKLIKLEKEIEQLINR